MKNEIKELKRRIRRLEKITKCYAQIIAAVYDGEKIEDADPRIRTIYKL